MEVSEVVERAIAEVGPAELMGRLGYTLNTAARQIERWQKGHTKPDYAHTLILLDAAGLLLQPEDVRELRRLNVDLAALRSRRHLGQ